MTLQEIIARANEAVADGSLARCLNVEPHYAAQLIDAASVANHLKKKWRADGLGDEEIENQLRSLG